MRRYCCINVAGYLWDCCIMMTYKEGMWHAMSGLKPQYEHMKDSGGTGYDEYMQGYNKVKEEQTLEATDHKKA